jgi:hypothetical protein
MTSDYLIVHSSLYLLLCIHHKLVLEAQMIALRDGICFVEIIAAIRKHAGSTFVQVMGWKLLSHLVENKQGSVEACAASIIPSMISAMWTFASRTDIQHHCVRTLFLVIRNSSVHKAEAIRAGAIRAIEAAVQAHASEPEVQQFGSKALAVLMA